MIYCPLFQKEESIFFKMRKTILGFTFFLPFGIIYFVFYIIPLYNALILGFYKWDIFKPRKFIGLLNFQKMMEDPKFISSLWNTVCFTILSVPPLVILALLLAVLLNSKMYFKKLSRLLFFIPYILSISVVCSTWSLLYQPEFGAINQILNILGFQSISWLGDSKYAMNSIVITTVWWTIGFNLILYLAGLQQIPTTIYEAAKIDGASSFRVFRSITLPLLKRTHVLIIILQVIASFQIFGQVFIMTGGGPHGSTRVLVQYIYTNAFSYFKMGYAQAMSLSLFLIMFIISMVQIKLMFRRGESL